MQRRVKERREERRGDERGKAYRIVSRFIASVAWNNGSTEMFDLPALSAHDGRGERDGCDGRERDTVIPNEVAVLRPFNSAQFSAAVYLPVACIFIAIPKTNSVGA